MSEYLTVGNWKMNTAVCGAAELASSIKQNLASSYNLGVSVVLCPPFISLVSVREIIKGSSLKLGAQNMFYEPNGAFTGEISAPMLADICDFVIIGHSERRHILRESYQVVNRKMVAAISEGLRPILCVGETLTQRRQGAAESVVRRQLTTGLTGVDDVNGLVVAYEPVWAIGTGESATPSAVVDITGEVIRAELEKLFGKRRAMSIPVLYGGSVNSENVGSFLQEPSIQGTLVGGASLDADQFAKIVSLSAKIRAKA